MYLVQKTTQALKYVLQSCQTNCPITLSLGQTLALSDAGLLLKTLHLLPQISAVC